MTKLNIKRILSSDQPVIRWFLIGISSLSIIFFIVLIPLISYCKKNFSASEIQKQTQHLNFGISQLETTIYTVNSAEQSIRQDSRFLPFYYMNSDASDLSIQTGIKVQEYVSSLLFPLNLVSDWGLSFSSKMAVTSDRFVSVKDASSYYQEAFQIDNLTYDEWNSQLQQYKTRFMPVHHVRTMDADYDALIYSIPCAKDSHLYVCLNILDIKKALVGASEMDNFYITLEDSDGICLYTDLPSEISDYHSVTQNCPTGNLIITIHIPDTTLAKYMTPLYTFLGIYLTICFIVVIGFTIISSRISTKPVIDVLQSFQTDLQACQTTIDTQIKVIQARYMEKALHGSLATEADYELFFSYFPKFPHRFCMILAGLIEKTTTNNSIPYTTALSIVQQYLEQCAPNAYIQQLTPSTMLIIVDEHVYNEFAGILNYLIENINREEPCYHAWGFASKTCDHPRCLYSSYLQIQDLRRRISPESLNHLCVVSDYSAIDKSGFQMSDTLSIYSAIVNGNDEVALMKLDNYSTQLTLHNYSIFEMFRSILLCIKQEYSELLIDIEVPLYNTETDMYFTLSETIQQFSNKFRVTKEEKEADSFAQQIKAYIDLHYTENTLCNTTLEEHFGCSYAKIRKAFVQEVGTPIAAYIEKKRMARANELLFLGEDSVANVATKCGYTNYSSFHKAYRRVFGHAPSDLKPNR